MPPHQVLCVPRGDLRRSIERVPSRWILQIASAIAGERWWSEELLAAKRDWLTHVASFDAGIRHMDFPATEQEHRLRALMAQGSTRLSLPVLTATGDATLGAGAEVVAARRSDHFTRFDGNLGGLAVPSPAETVTSATRLERWAVCPFAYLLRNLLGVDEVENPEDELRITPRDKGSLVHQALEDFIGEVLSRPSADQPGPSEPWSPSDRARMVEICERVSAEYEDRGLTGRPIFWRQDKKRILADLLRFLEADSADVIAGEPTAPGPMAAELAFGLPARHLGHRSRSTCPMDAACNSEAKPTESMSAPMARSASSTTRQARPNPTQGAERGQSRRPEGQQAAAGRSTARPLASSGRSRTRRCGPSTGSSPRGGASSASGTRSRPPCWRTSGKHSGPS